MLTKACIWLRFYILSITIKLLDDNLSNIKGSRDRVLFIFWIFDYVHFWEDYFKIWIFIIKWNLNDLLLINLTFFLKLFLALWYWDKLILFIELIFIFFIFHCLIYPIPFSNCKTIKKVDLKNKYHFYRLYSSPNAFFAEKLETIKAINSMEFQ